MSWDVYIDFLMKHDSIVDAAICGCLPGQESVWASSPGGELGGITKSEIVKLVRQDREDLECSGVELAGMKCAVVNDHFYDEPDRFIFLKKKEGDLSFICVAASDKALVITKGKGKEPSQEQIVSTTEMAGYLTRLGF